MIDTEKLSQITALDAGAHDATSGAMCAMEAVAWIVGEPWSDAPQCASPVVAAFVRSWNDALPDADRTRLLLPLIPEIVGTRTTDADEEVRAWMVTDWLVRAYTPRWLRVAGLAPHAVALENLAPIDDHTSANAAEKTVDAARDAARDAVMDAVGAAAWDAAVDAALAAAGDAVGAAAWSAALAAVEDAAGDAVGDAALDAAVDAALAAAGDAVGAAVGTAARARLCPIVAETQSSAQDLVRRMCAVGRVAAAKADASHGARATKEVCDA